ncbi:hypothetical protein WA026_002040 [Henosepilachna vigintioctopunctata]|uniref:Uncharacterized protein n=1 Tax=Henosepilachna vigintioctopunctata TaxID=420089 RepID=A0AAW1UJY0_9CUCU
MTHTYALDINGTMRIDSASNNSRTTLHNENGCIKNNKINKDLENSDTYDVNQQKDYVYKMHNYCCNPEKLKRKCDENYHKLVLKKKELGSARRKIKKLKNRVAFLKDVIKNMKQNGNEVKESPNSL